MGWKETCAVEERMRFMVAVEKGEESFAAICRRFGVSRRVGYKWLARFEEEGAAGLLDRSRTPLHHPQAMAPNIAERCLEVRRAHPTWGPVKVRAYLERRAPATEWPVASTIGVPAAVQRGAAAPGARQCHARRLLSGFRAAL
ncbi:hypothetical protein V1290_000311 [Bradyrhizobium sp. AZCC 1578]|uniref:helix-turn-helix domain-containing protein n=1 Tax=Bradyrhizobium sp. AZCC 1578 TaxID=3117027 RepID=UPI00303F5B5C